MIAAIYARKSTTQTNVDEDAKSVERQIANGTAFIIAQGWTLGPIFKADDAISGAETRKLRDKQRLLEMVRSGKAPFQVLVMQKRDRLSRRDGAEAVVELTSIAKAGIEVWFYAKRERFTYGDFKSNVSNYLEGEFNAEFRRAISEKTTETMQHKAKLGHVTGRRGFGFTNITVEKHGDLEINEDQRPVVERIFQLRAAGRGYSKIAKTLNDEGAPAPRPQQGRPKGWSHSTVRAILLNPLYRGELIQGKTKTRNEDGEVAPTLRPESEWVRVQREDLRIVSDEVWAAAQTQRRRMHLGITKGTKPRALVRRDHESQYLLTGFVRCATCGGSVGVVSRSHGRKRAYFYGCTVNWKRGASICPNDLVLPIDRVNDAVLKAIAHDVLKPAIVRGMIDLVLERLVPANIESRVEELRRQQRALDTKIDNLTAAIEQGGSKLPSIIALLTERQKERDALVGEIASAATLHQIHVDRAAIEADVQKTVGDWRGLLNGSVQDGRQMLREVLEAPLKFERDGKTYRFSAPVATGKLIAGAVLPPIVASPTGFEPVFWP